MTALLGVGRTPVFFVNGLSTAGAEPFDVPVELIEWRM